MCPLSKLVHVIAIVVTTWGRAAVPASLPLAGDATAGPIADWPARGDGAALVHSVPAPMSAQNACFSPAGDHIAFTLWQDGYNAGDAGVWRVPAAGGTRTRVLDEPGQAAVNMPGPCWSRPPRIVLASDRIANDEIWTVPAAGGAPVRVTSHAGAAHYIEPTFSPDGRRIVFESQPEVPEASIRASLVTVNADGTGERVIVDGPATNTDNRQPSWSPDGRRIAFQRRSPGSEDWDVWTVLPDGTSLRRVTRTVSSDTDPSWSPNGQWIVYSSDYDAAGGTLTHANLFMVSVATGRIVRVTHAGVYDGAPAWSPDGRWIAFESATSTAADARTSLWRIRAPLPPLWRPTAGTSWQVQYTGILDPSVQAQVFSVDLFDTPAEAVADLKAPGRRVVCYLNAGAWENWREDKDRFPAVVLGRPLAGWPGERWLDVRRLDVLRPIMEARMDQCRAKGFHAVDPDNVNGYQNDTGFPLTSVHQVAYNRFLAEAAHARGLSIGLKNTGALAGQLLDVFEFSVVEQCVEYGECELYAPFVRANKSVLDIEYARTTAEFCPETSRLGFFGMRKRLSLDAWRQLCAA